MYYIQLAFLKSINIDELSLLKYVAAISELPNSFHNTDTSQYIFKYNYT